MVTGGEGVRTTAHGAGGDDDNDDLREVIDLGLIFQLSLAQSRGTTTRWCDTIPCLPVPGSFVDVWFWSEVYLWVSLCSLSLYLRTKECGEYDALVGS